VRGPRKAPGVPAASWGYLTFRKPEESTRSDPALAIGLGDVWLLWQQPVAVDDGGRDVGELRVGPARVVAQHLEGISVVDRMTLHQDALGSLGDRAAAERALEVVILGEPAEHDVDRVLPVVDLRVAGLGLT
jgi:hypothetical protein